MRDERQMTELIRNFARREEDIRAVFLGGSRANPNARRDLLQDYDVIFAVRDVGHYVRDRSWISGFGEILIMQEPDLLDGCVTDSRYVFLMQFMDGNRIDLTFLREDEVKERVQADSQTVCLLDKDGHYGTLPLPSDQSYWIGQPEECEFLACCNEFWWTAPYVAKGLWRGELLYAAGVFEECTRAELFKMLTWRVGEQGGWRVSAGKYCKDLPGYLSREERARLTSLYPPLNRQDLWNALEAACGWFAAEARGLAGRLNLRYRADEESNVIAFLKDLRALPAGAKELRPEMSKF